MMTYQVNLRCLYNQIPNIETINQTLGSNLGITEQKKLMGREAINFVFDLEGKDFDEIQEKFKQIANQLKPYIYSRLGLEVSFQGKRASQGVINILSNLLS